MLWMYIFPLAFCHGKEVLPWLNKQLKLTEDSLKTSFHIKNIYYNIKTQTKQDF